MVDVRRRDLGDLIGATAAQVLGGVAQGGGVQPTLLRDEPSTSEYVPLLRSDLTGVTAQFTVAYSPPSALWSGAGDASTSTSVDIGFLAPDVDGAWGVTGAWQLTDDVAGATWNVGASGMEGIGGESSVQTGGFGNRLNTYWEGHLGPGTPLLVSADYSDIDNSGSWTVRLSCRLLGDAA